MIGLDRDEIDDVFNRVLAIARKYEKAKKEANHELIPLWDLEEGAWFYFDTDVGDAWHTKIEALSSIDVTEDSSTGHDLLVRVSLKQGNKHGRWAYMTMLSVDYEECVNHGE